MKNIFQRGMAWHTYLNLEKDFIDVTRYVALDRGNRKVWSEKIADLLLLTGSKVDSLFKEMRKSSLLPSSKSLTALRRKSKPNIEDYRLVYEPIHKLSGVKLTAHHGLTNYGVIRPFNPFLPQKYPAWWQAYNKVKHGLFENIRQGTLDNLVHALGALFALNVLHLEGRKYLVMSGVVVMGASAAQRISTCAPTLTWESIRKSFIGVPGNVAADAWASSQVFLHLFRKDLGTKA